MGFSRDTGNGYNALFLNLARHCCMNHGKRKPIPESPGQHQLKSQFFTQGVKSYSIDTLSEV
jgi:hypothetical protein